MLYFLFVQFEFTHALGPTVGRYVVEPDLPVAGPSSEHDHEASPRERRVGVEMDVGASDVLVVSAVQADVAPRVKIRRKPKVVAEVGRPAPVSLMVVTFVQGSQPFAKEEDAALALEALISSPERQRDFVGRGLREINIAIRAYRSGSRDPYVQEVTQRDARRILLGYGNTDDVRDGGWQSVAALGEQKAGWRRRSELLRPSETVALALGRRMSILESEDVLARALIDLDHSRSRAAAQQVRGALALLVGEATEAVVDGLPLGSLAADLPRAEELATVSLGRELDAGEVQELEDLVAKITTTFDAWRYGHRG